MEPRVVSNPWAGISERLRRYYYGLPRLSLLAVIIAACRDYCDLPRLLRLAVLLGRLLESAFVSFLLLIGRSRRPSHESNNDSILYFLIAARLAGAAKALLSNPIKEVSKLVNRQS